ncbi:MAG: DegT/DnrJ/EryC1/StrS family aminotransferase, partial [Mariprofundaceae bacterium]|nr:DegT/DnrJ/EryC1/StrS family aminotransferase [Mariprofundaceae bacterium]
MIYDVFNGDADGLCALHQLRLAKPAESELVTGVKRDISLLKRMNAKAGDEIILPGFAFMGAANVAIQMGIKPVFAEVNSDTWCLDPSSLDSLITPKTKAIIPIHTYGNVCRTDEIKEIADTNNLLVIEDCAESLFSKYKGQQSGKIGAISTYSFQATKTITTGEGGLVVTDSDEIADIMMLYRSHGMRRKDKHYWHEIPGHNFRLTNFQAAMGVAQLETKDLICSERQRVYNKYKELLSNVEGLDFQVYEEEVTPVVWAVAMILNEDAFGNSRDEVMALLKEKNIETRPGFFSPEFMELYESPHLPVSAGLTRNVLSLPSFPSLTDAEIEYICEQLIALKS